LAELVAVADMPETVAVADIISSAIVSFCIIAGNRRVLK